MAAGQQQEEKWSNEQVMAAGDFRRLLEIQEHFQEFAGDEWGAGSGGGYGEDEGYVHIASFSS